MKKIWNSIMRIWYSIPLLRVSISVKQQDKRAYQWFLERQEHGFDRRELWNLHDTISNFIHDRLVWFSKQCPITPKGLTHEQWREIMADMIYAFSTMKGDRIEEVDHDRVKRGIKSFIKYYYALWW